MRSPSDILIVEDMVRMVRPMARLVRESQGGACRFAVADPDEVIERPERFGSDLVLIDALSTERAGDVPGEPKTRSRLVAIEVVRALHSTGAPPPPLVAYSQAMESPAINIPLSELGDLIQSRHTVWDLMSNTRAVIRGDAPGVSAPGDDDYGDLGLGPDAKVVAALDLAQTNPEVWHWVATGDHAERNRKWLLYNLHPLLGERCPRSCRHIISLLRAITRLGPSAP